MTVYYAIVAGLAFLELVAISSKLGKLADAASQRTARDQRLDEELEKIAPSSGAQR